MKVCTKCGESKLPTEFNKSKHHKNGYLPSCRKCVNIYQTYYRNRNVKLSVEKPSTKPGLKKFNFLEMAIESYKPSITLFNKRHTLSKLLWENDFMASFETMEGDSVNIRHDVSDLDIQLNPHLCKPRTHLEDYEEDSDEEYEDDLV